MSIPHELATILPVGTARTWVSIRDVLPAGAYLGGGTAIAVHLRHRVSRDLDFFLREPVDLEALVDALEAEGRMVIQQLDLEPGRQTLTVLFDTTRLQLLEASSVRVLEPLLPVAGVMVAGLGDLLAMKLKVICDRGELRDDFDLLAIERQGHRRVEEGIALALEKYRPKARQAFVQTIVRGLGYLDDVQEDPGIPATKAEVAGYWERRVPEIVRSLSRYA
jgi:Nucleotidyl transferase AbiEii toxin, Type IV TA system